MNRRVPCTTRVAVEGESRFYANVIPHATPMYIPQQNEHAILNQSDHSSTSELYPRTSSCMRSCNPSSRSIYIGREQGPGC